MPKELSTFAIDPEIKQEFKTHCARLDHKMSLVVETMMEKFNSNQRYWIKLIRDHEQQKKDRMGDS